MPIVDATDWSPADQPHAIAVSEAQWWMRTAKLAILRIRDAEDQRVGFGSRQIDARLLVFALKQLLAAEDLEQRALRDLGLAPTAGTTLARARQRFESALPDIKNMRDALMHFEDWARGAGRGPQQDQRRAGVAKRDVARMFWGFGYNPDTGSVSLGPWEIDIDTAARESGALAHAIYLAAHQVDRRDTEAMRARVTAALDRAVLPHDWPEDMIVVSPGHDLQIWLSLRISSDADPALDEQAAAQIITTLAADGLQLVSPTDPDADGMLDRLTRREPLHVRKSPP